MAEESRPKMSLTGFENHMQTLLTGLLLAGLIWTVSTLQSLTVEVAEMRVEVKNLKAQIETLK